MPRGKRHGGTSMNTRVAGLAAAVAASLSLSAAPPNAQPGASVDGAKIAHADTDPGEWLTHGRNYSEQRFSPLKQIDANNVKDLGVAWEYRTYSVRGLEATPIVADGGMFITLPWSIVIALGAATGKELWEFDPQGPGRTGRRLRWDGGNRGGAPGEG